MTALTLTTERRAQLSELLGDEQRMETEFPKVAAYLDTAPGMPGSGNDETDRLFDLRMLNFMTGDNSVSEDPYWDIVSPCVSTREGRRVIDGGRAQGSSRLAYAQTILQEAYAYAVPSPETIAWISDFSCGRGLIEQGAGRGYWAAQLERYGVRVDAFDIEPPDTADNVSFPRAAGQQEVWKQVSDLTSFRSRLSDAGDSVLFLCWPPGWENPMASDALETFEQYGGDRLVYIGEPAGGKTGNTAFFTALSARWQLTSQDEQFVTWWNLRDGCQGWIRR